MPPIPEALAAARLRAANERPYLASALWSLMPVERKGLNTVAVDRYYRLYYDPQKLNEWSVLEAATVLIHEITHLLREHPQRAAEMQVEGQPWFYATDAAINDDLVNEGLTLPGKPATITPKGELSEGYIVPKTFDMEDNDIEEVYYAELMDRADGNGGGGLPDPNGTPNDSGESSGQGGGGGGQPQEDDDGDGDGQGQGSGGGGGGGQSDQQDEGDGDGQGDGSGGGGGQQQQQQQDGDGSGGGDGQSDGDGESQSNPCGGSGGGDQQQDQQQQQQSGDGGGDGSGDSQDSGQNSDGGSGGGGQGQGEGQGQGNTGGGNCGSCAGGGQRPWEDDAPGTPGASDGLKPGEQKLIQRHVAEAVRDAAKTRGTVPGQWAEWAEEVLTKKIPWQREFTSALRGAISYASGMMDYTYQRMSRRQSTFPEVVLPGMRAPLPNIVWVQDTSGSMSQEDMGASFDQADSCFKQVGFPDGVPIISVDARAQKIRKFRPGQKKKMMQEMAVGRGGTDMRVGIEEAMKMRPKPCAIVVSTDGYTPWPDKPLAGVKLIALIIKSGRYGGTPEEGVPAWARTIVVDLDEDLRGKSRR